MKITNGEATVSLFLSSRTYLTYINFFHLAGSLLVYSLAALRKLAREENHGGLKVDADGKTGLLTLPITVREISEILVANKEVLEKEMAGDEDSVEALKEILNRPGRDDDDITSLVSFSDKYAKSDLVYGISVDTFRKRITVSFRGSTTAKDWWTDFQFFMNKKKNPLKEKYPDLPDDIYLHTGFDGAQSCLSFLMRIQPISYFELFNIVSFEYAEQDISMDRASKTSLMKFQLLVVNSMN